MPTVYDDSRTGRVDRSESGKRPVSSKDALLTLEDLAVRSIESIGKLAREASCDPQEIAQSLDRIDFSLGQTFRDLHSE